MSDLIKKLEEMDKIVVRGKYISNAYNIEELPSRDEFLKVVPLVKVVYHNDLTELRVSAEQKKRMMADNPYLEDSDFIPDGTMFKLDREEFICSLDSITLRFAEVGE